MRLENGRIRASVLAPWEIGSVVQQQRANFQTIAGPLLEMEMEKNEARLPPSSRPPLPPLTVPPPPTVPPERAAAIPLTWQQHHRGLKFSAELDTLWQRRCSHRHQG